MTRFTKIPLPQGLFDKIKEYVDQTDEYTSVSDFAKYWLRVKIEELNSKKYLKK